MPLDGLDPDELAAAGLDSDGNVIDPSRFADWLDDAGGAWDRYAGSLMGWDTAIIAETAGAPSPDEWTGITIHGEDDGSREGSWWVEIATDDGRIIEVPFGHIFDLAWDIYDLAGILDIEIERDIDTGSAGQ